MTKNNIQKDYLEILKKLATSKKDQLEEDLPLDSILNDSNHLFTQIKEDTSELKLDAKVTAIHSDIFLKRFSRNIKNRKVDFSKFIKLVNENKLQDYFKKISALNKKCKFAKFIDFDFNKIVKEKKASERIVRVIKDAKTLEGQNKIEEESCVFLNELDEIFKNNSKIKFYDCVLDRNSFGKTIENVFYISIAIRSKKIMLNVENEEIFIVKYVENNTNEKIDNHIILDIDYEKYISLIENCSNKSI